MGERLIHRQLADKAIREMRSKPREMFDSLHGILNLTLLEAGRLALWQASNGEPFWVVRDGGDNWTIAEWLLP